jgi:hypothetical protein
MKRLVILCLATLSLCSCNPRSESEQGVLGLENQNTQFEKWLNEHDSGRYIFDQGHLLQGAEIETILNCWKMFKQKIPKSLQNIRYYQFDAGPRQWTKPGTYEVSILTSARILRVAQKSGQEKLYRSLVVAAVYTIDRKTGEVIEERFEPTPLFLNRDK